MSGKISGNPSGAYDLGQNAEINVTPFVDIMLVLLIIFMVAIPLATTSINLNLPPAPNSKPVQPFFLSLQQNGRLFMSPGGETSLASIGQDLMAAGKGPQDMIMVRADGEVAYGRFVTLVDTLRNDGFLKVGLVSETL